MAKVLTYTIVLVDDYKPFRDVTCDVLQKREDFDVRGQAADGLEAVDLARRLQPDLILLDISLPKLNGIEAAKRIRTLSPGSKILFCSQISSRAVIAEVLRIGAQGYLLKADVARELLCAVDEVLQGGQYVSRRLRRVDPELH